jgi:dihydroorotate dehydrogenase
VYERLLRPLLFRLSADQAHEVARIGLRFPLIWRALTSRTSDPRLRTDLAGIRLSSPVGLAPGFDKNADLLPALDNLGFGYLVVGSITRQPRFGNPFPRLVRYPDRLAIANSMGLPNHGLDAALEALRSARSLTTPVIASVAGLTADDLLFAARAVEPHVAAVEIGLVCPNTTETERLEERRIFETLAEGLAGSIGKPVFVKLPPFHSPADRDRVLGMVDVCATAGLRGVSLSGTRPVEEPRLGMKRGSLAGRPVFDDSLRIVREVAERSAGRLVLKASGGVFSGADALAMLEAGASAVEVYSAFIYRGWDVAGLIAGELATLLRERGIVSLAGLRRQAVAS